jgi:hypothetical protein
MNKDTTKTTRPVVVAATAVFALSGAIYEQDNIVPERYYEPSDEVKSSYSNVLNLNNINQLNLNAINQIETFNSFIKNINENTKDLDPEIVDIVNDNIFNLI